MINEMLDALLALQSLESEESATKEIDRSQLRTKIPSQILAHFDRFQARGKKGIVLVRNGVCSGCHMRLPTGAIAHLLHGTDIQICDSCGRYLALEKEVAVVQAAEPVAMPKSSSPKRARKRAATHAQ